MKPNYRAGRTLKCEGSGNVQMIDWGPTDKVDALTGGPWEGEGPNPRPYPGAAVCVDCSYGVLLRKGSVHDAVSASGFEGEAGTLRTHYVTFDETGYPVSCRLHGEKAA